MSPEISALKSAYEISALVAQIGNYDFLTEDQKILLDLALRTANKIREADDCGHKNIEEKDTERGNDMGKTPPRHLVPIRHRQKKNSRPTKSYVSTSKLIQRIFLRKARNWQRYLKKQIQIFGIRERGNS